MRYTTGHETKSKSGDMTQSKVNLDQQGRIMYWTIQLY